MTRCARNLVSPAMFYRILCFTLICLVFVFCLIITGLFVDIDALISSKTNVKSLHDTVNTKDYSLGNYGRFIPTDKTPRTSKDSNDISWSQEYEFPLRTRRSPDNINPNGMKIKNKKVNNILKNRLVSLLQEMESENIKTNDNSNPNANIKLEDDNKEDNDSKARYINKLKEIIANLDDLIGTSKKDGHIHLAIQNILLEGMVNHMDLNEVYKKVEELAKSFKANTQKQGSDLRNVYGLNHKVSPSVKTKHVNIQTGVRYNVNTQLRQANGEVDDKNKNEEILAKLVQYHQLRDELSDKVGHLSKVNDDGKYDKTNDDVVDSLANSPSQDNIESKTSYERYAEAGGARKTEITGPKLLIKASIDVSPLENLNTKDHNSMKDDNDVQGLIEMTYKGVPIKFQRNTERTIYGNSGSSGAINKELNNANEDILKRILDALNSSHKRNTQFNYDTDVQHPQTAGKYKIIKKRDLAEIQPKIISDLRIDNMGTKKWADIGVDFDKERMHIKRNVSAVSENILNTKYPRKLGGRNKKPDIDDKKTIFVHHKRHKRHHIFYNHTNGTANIKNNYTNYNLMQNVTTTENRPLIERKEAVIEKGQIDLRINNMGNKKIGKLITHMAHGQGDNDKDNKTAELRVHIKRDTNSGHKNVSLFDILSIPKIAQEKNIDSLYRIISKRSIETDEDQSYMPTKKVNTKKKMFHNPVTTTVKNKNKLYVKIETHFKEGDINAAEKKNIIQKLMNKIKKVIHSHEVKPRTEKVMTEIKKEILHVRKRYQLPIDLPSSTTPNRTIYKNGTYGHKMYNPSITSNIEKRQTEPIIKVLKFRNEPLGSLTFKKLSKRTSRNGPDFTVYDSREIGDIQEDFVKQSHFKIIPQRVQRPIYLKDSEDIEESKEIFQVGNDQMVIGNLDGTGISIGYNQYIKNENNADKEESELRNILKEYQQHFNNYHDSQQNSYEHRKSETPDSNYAEELKQKKYGYFSERKVFKRSIERRSSMGHKIVSTTTDDDYFNKHENSNEYVVLIEQGNPLGLLNYQDILKGYSDIESTRIGKDNDKKENKNNIDPAIGIESSESSKIKRVAAILENNPFDKILMPSEIFSLSTLLDRKKREVNVVEFKSKSSNRFKRHATTRRLYKHIHRNNIGTTFSKFRQGLKTQFKNVLSKRRRKHIKNRRRHKRQAYNQLSMKFRHRNDRPIAKPKYSEEELFVVSDERNINEDITHSSGDVKIYAPKHKNDFLQKYVSLKLPSFNTKTLDHEDLFQKISSSGLQNRQELMRNYPHILKEDSDSDTQNIKNSKEYFSKNYNITNMKSDQMKDIDAIMDDVFADDDISEKTHHQEQNFLGTNIDNKKYKVTVKVFPKNSTDISSGFKETHTSINKTINKNGLIYVSQFNLSQISHIQNPNENKTKHTLEEQGYNYKTRLIEHQTKLESQLHRLQSQKDRIDELLQPDTNKDKSDLIEVVLPFNPPKLVKLSKELVSSIVTSALTKLQENRDTEIQIKNSRETTIMSTTELISTNPIAATKNSSQNISLKEDSKTQDDNYGEKKSLRSDTEIIARIDKNTHTLEKLVAFLEGNLNEDHSKQLNFFRTTPNKPIIDSVLLLNNVTPNDRKVSLNLDRPYYVDTSFNLLNDVHNSIKIAKDFKDKTQNASDDIASPLMYAMQRPYYMPLKADPITNIIYHGHIHANNDGPMKSKETIFAAIDNGLSKGIEGSLGNSNNTKYFIDSVNKVENIRPSTTSVKDENTVRIDKKSDGVNVLNK